MSTIALKPRWIIPVQPTNTIYENHVLVIENNLISQIVPAEEAQLPKDTKWVELPDHVLIPGLINMHTHSPMTLLRGLADDLPLMTWLNDYIWPAEKQCLNREFIAEGTQIAMAEMIKGGTTCFNEHYFQADVLADAAIASGMRATIGLWLGNLPVLDGDSVAAQLKTAEKVLASHGGVSPLTSFAMSPHSPYLLEDNHLTQLRDFAKNNKLNIHMHVHESLNEIETSMQQYNMRPLARMSGLGLLSERFQCVHMTQIDNQDLAIMADSGAHAITCPHSNLKLASGMCPVHNLLEKNINVAIGTDGAASNNDLDMLDEMQTTALLTKALAQDPTKVPAEQALAMATINGAKALGLADKIGSLEVGKQADITAIDLSDLATQPVYNPLSHVVYAANKHQVSHVWVAGKCLLDQGELTTLDETKLKLKAQQWQQKVMASLNK